LSIRAANFDPRRAAGCGVRRFGEVRAVRIRRQQPRGLPFAKKTFVLTNDPFYFKRVPLPDVREIRIRRLRPLFLYVLAVAMVVIGAYTTS